MQGGIHLHKTICKIPCYLWKDFDIAGEHERMLPDAECIKIACAVLNELMAGEIIVMVSLKLRPEANASKFNKLMYRKNVIS